MENQTLDHVSEIWHDDLLGRRSEAELLAGYISSIFDRPGFRRGERAYTIAVDADYGEGKSFFLQRLAKHLSISHPVAYIDAWADDLADQPLVALLATLKAALSPIIDHPEVKHGWAKLAKKTGEVAKVVAIGAAKRSLGIIISHTAVEYINSIIDHPNEYIEEKSKDAIKDTSEEAFDSLSKGLKIAGNMESQVSDFEAAQMAMRETKESLHEIIKNLPIKDLSAPIVIIVDELDRCRPTYAIKLLEEIKHLFDVPGVVFILGLHGDQLSRAVEGVYGPHFDGKSYLRRFINRRYSLQPDKRNGLISKLISASGLHDENFYYTSSYRDKNSGDVRRNSLIFIIEYYAREFGLTPRDLFNLIDLLETATAISKPNRLIIQYLVPLLVGHMRGLAPGDTPALSERSGISWLSRNEEYDPQQLLDKFKLLSGLDRSGASKSYNASESYPESIIYEAWIQAGNNLNAVPNNYPRLVSAVSRFRKE